MSWTENDVFEDYLIEETDLDRDSGPAGQWKVTLEHGLEVAWPRGDGHPQPRKGQTTRLFGDVLHPWGLQGIVVGKDSDALDEGKGKVVFYRTAEEQAVYVEEKERAALEDRLKRYEEHAEDFEARVSALPAEYQDQIYNAKEGAADKAFYLAFEYEVEIVKYEHAYMLVMTTDTRASLETFMALPSQSKMGSVWGHMADARLEELEKLLKDHPEREDLRTEERRLTEYAERGFYIEHTPEVLAEIFEAARDLLPEPEEPAADA